MISSGGGVCGTHAKWDALMPASIPTVLLPPTPRLKRKLLTTVVSPTQAAPAELGRTSFLGR